MIQINSKLHEARKTVKGVLLSSKIIGGPTFIIDRYVFLQLEPIAARDLAIKILMDLIPTTILKEVAPQLTRLAQEANNKS